MNDILDNVRGGLCVPFIAHLHANDPSAPWYNKEAPESRMCYVDYNSLYPSAMSKPLPLGSYKKLNLKDDDAWNCSLVEVLSRKYNEDDSEGFLCRITYHIPPDRQDRVDFAPVRKMKVLQSELSERQRRKAEKNMRNGRTPPVLES